MVDLKQQRLKVSGRQALRQDGCQTWYSKFMFDPDDNIAHTVSMLAFTINSASDYSM
jgi:hypothetical protein